MSKHGLAAMVKSIKSDYKAERSPSDAINKLIDDYILGGEFQEYLWKHQHDLARYVSNPFETTEMLFRASQAGTCPQRQAYQAMQTLFERGEQSRITIKVEETRPATQIQALLNGTFFHLRFHMIFDALAEKGMLEVLASEELKVSPKFNLSGHIDKLIRFEFGGTNMTAVVDFKSIKQYYYDQLVKPTADHMAQQHAYKLLGFNANHWIELYESKDNHQRKVYVIDYSEIEIHRLTQMYADLNEYVLQSMNNVPSMELPLIQDWCGNCPFNDICMNHNAERRK